MAMIEETALNVPHISRSGQLEMPENGDSGGVVVQDLPLIEVLQTISALVQQRAETWRRQPLVSIGRARVVTDLEETRIRYFEDLGVLQPEKTTAQAGASRLYTLADLRCLYALSLLVKDYRFRPAEAATIVKEHRALIEHGDTSSLTSLLANESNAITNGFFLARLVSQLIDAAQATLESRHVGLRVQGLMLVLNGEPLYDQPSADVVQRLGATLWQAPEDTLIALDRSALDDQPELHISPTLLRPESGRNDTTILFYSRERWELPTLILRLGEQRYYTLYRPAPGSAVGVLFLIAAHEDAGVLHLFTPATGARALLFERLSQLCAHIFGAFRNSSVAKNYRYRSDGFQLAQTQHMYDHLLATIRGILFPDDPGSMIVLMTPNSIDLPTSLAILAHAGYDPTLAPRARLSLDGEGQGLSGRAFKLREPFVSLDARHDKRIEYAVEEGCRSAVAVPLATSWGIVPFGVLYLATKSAQRPLTSETAYLGLILGSILSELLGRWWLTRLRRTQERELHQQVERLVHWIDSLDQHGKGFEQAVEQMVQLWRQINPDDSHQGKQPLAMLVLDIDSYRRRVQVQSNEIVPLKAQAHVRAAVYKFLPDVPLFWFKNDHAFLLLTNCALPAALQRAEQIVGQVRALPLAVLMPGKGQKAIPMSVSIAVKAMTYQDLRHLSSDDGPALRLQIQSMIDELHEQTHTSRAGTIRYFMSEGWRSLALGASDPAAVGSEDYEVFSNPL